MALTEWQWTVLNSVIGRAKSLPDLIAMLRREAPGLTSMFEGKALLSSRSPWGTLLVAVIAFLVTKFGLGWDDATDELVAGGGILVGSYIMRYFTRAPIKGLLPREEVKRADVTDSIS